MIRFSLHCDNDHGFEAWFRSGADFERQKALGFVTCPHCNSVSVEKALMAPAVRTGARSVEGAEPMAPQTPPHAAMPVAFGGQAEGLARFQAMVRDIRARSENVGPRFAAQARAMHEGAIPERAIIGEASADEVRQLIEDNIPVAPLPPLPEDKN